MQKKRGISLIVLVITIIVMIVLAGAIILSLNNSGIINKASEAVDLTNEANVQEFAQTIWAEAYLETDKSQKSLEEYVMAGLKKAGVDVEEYAINVTEEGVSVVKSVVETVDEVPIPKGFVASKATGENTVSKGLVIYEGSEVVTDANVEEARRSRNQYVWVPVDKETFETTFVRQNFSMSCALSSTLGTYCWEVLPTTELNKTNLQYMTKETLKEAQKMYASVKKYGGFYIARYEAGIDTQRTAKGNAEDLPGIKEGTKVYSVAGKIPYMNIPWTWNNVMYEDTNGAVDVARNIYREDNSSYGVVSTLIYGVQWDRAVQWFIDTGAMTSEQVRKTEESIAFGNYSGHVISSEDELNDGALVWDYTTNKSGSYVSKDSDTITYPKTSGITWLLSTGALKAANINNIYDMAGNMWEWTMEGVGTAFRVRRGGSFYSDNVIAIRYEGYYPNSASILYGLRIALYIK